MRRRCEGLLTILSQADIWLGLVPFRRRRIGQNSGGSNHEIHERHENFLTGTFVYSVSFVVQLFHPANVRSARSHLKLNLAKPNVNLSWEYNNSANPIRLTATATIVANGTIEPLSLRASTRSYVRLTTIVDEKSKVTAIEILGIAYRWRASDVANCTLP